jgi:hypothetical protein
MTFDKSRGAIEIVSSDEADVGAYWVDLEIGLEAFPEVANTKASFFVEIFSQYNQAPTIDPPPPIT